MAELPKAPFRRIVVALSCSDADAGLVEYALLLSRFDAGIELHWVHIAPARTSQTAVAELRSRIERQVAEASGESSERVRCDVLQGDLTDRLLSFLEQAGADLVLVGHRQSHGGRRSLARRLAMKAPCSVWMAPNGSPASIKRILVAIDFSARAADALAKATAIAQLANLEQCLALHVYFNRALVTYEEYDEIIQADEAEAFRIFVARVDLHGVDVAPVFEEGPNVAHTLHRLVAEHGIDLIVMGTRGLSRSAAVLLGSETEQAIIETKVPLLAVKRGAPHPRLLSVLLDPRLRDRNDAQFN